METIRQPEFRVRFAHNYFFTGRNLHGKALGSVFLTYSKTMSFFVACEVVKLLQGLGYKDAVVCTLEGRPAMPEDTHAQDLAHYIDEFRVVWGSDPKPEQVTKQSQ